MTANDVHDLLDRAGERAPRLDPSAIARQARASAVRRHRGRIVVLPAIAAVAALVAAATYSRLEDRQNGPAGTVIKPEPLHKGGTTNPTPTLWTCCAASDVTQAVHPGGTFALHFVPYQPGASNAVGKTQVLLVTLTGPYPDVVTLKAHALHDKAALSSAPLSVATGAELSPVSTIAIPATAATGYYNLTTSDTTAGATFEGGSIIEITK